jgi:hypothetical protein
MKQKAMLFLGFVLGVIAAGMFITAAFFLLEEFIISHQHWFA